MSEIVRYMKANKKQEGSPCAWCSNALQLGEDVAICEACGTVHHVACWDKNGGCGEKTCVNAPFKKVSTAITEVEEKRDKLKPGQMLCPHCKNAISSSATVCPNCRRFTSPDGLYHGPTSISPQARNAMILAIAGLFIFGIIFEPLAIREARRARESIAADYSLRGSGIASAAEVVAWIGLVLSVLSIIARLSQ